MAPVTYMLDGYSSTKLFETQRLTQIHAEARALQRCCNLQRSENSVVIVSPLLLITVLTL